MNFERVYLNLLRELLDESEMVDVGEWHAQDVSGIPALVTNELRHITIYLDVPETIAELDEEYGPNLPWADMHFAERVSGMPLNPPVSHAIWPFGNTAIHMADDKFSHSYPERYWPKYAEWLLNDPEKYEPRHGIRFEYGDLNDLVKLLLKNPLTRQAYLPVWFPEDLTAANQGERVPCSLGYHFLIRNNKLDCEYFMRSCEWVRHFRDDMYLTARLMQWVASEFLHGTNGHILEMGDLVVHIGSLHCMVGDRLRMEAEYASLTG